MPSLLHEGPLDLVREHPEIAVELIRGTTAIELPGELSVSLGPTDMSAVVPVQFLADMVVLITDTAVGEPVLAVIIEPQLRDSETKRYSWPVYVATARRIARCPAAVLLVLCPDPAEAEKCRRPIRTGHPGFDLVPIVIDSSATPGADGGSPYLTVFAAAMGGIDMEAEPGVRRVLDAITTLAMTDVDRQRMTAIILNLASNAARQLLEALMETGEYKKTFVDRIHDDGISIGVAKGKAEGKAEAVISLLEMRGLDPTEEDRQRFLSCTDLAQLEFWFRRAAAVRTVAEVFAE